MSEPETLDKPWRSLVRRRRNLPLRRGASASNEPTLCPSCRRLTRTVGRGTCADCWQPKLASGEAAIRTPTPRTQPLGLLSMLDEVPDIVWIFALIACVAGLARGLVAMLT